MRDFAYAANQIPGLFAYYKGDGSPFASMTDYGPNALSAGMHGYYTTWPGQPAPGYLLDQHVPTASMSLQSGHGHVTYAQASLTAALAALVNGQSWSMVLAGLKPHDMSVARCWIGFGTSDLGANVNINADGSIYVSGGGGTSATSAAGVIQQYQSHIIIASYDQPAGRLTVYVGDWTGRFVTAIDHAAISPITGLANGTPLYLGVNKSAVTTGGDGFVDEMVVYAGHAISSSEATALFQAAGFSGALSYPTSKGHRNAPLNAAYPTGQLVEASSAAAVTEFAHYADTTFINGAGGFNYYQFDTSIYVVSKAFRQNPANWMKLNAPVHYGDQSQFMQFEDVPVPYGGRPPASTIANSAFTPAGGSDAHLAIWCPETDEYWETGGSSGYGANADAPSWTMTYGGKLTQFSLFMGNMGSEGATATGIPNLIGVPSVTELQDAIYNNVPLPHGLAAVMYDGLATHVWPAGRHDGSKASGSSVIEGQLYRLKHDAATSAAIAAMPHPTGRAMAQAAQTYGILVVDRNLFATLLQIEDKAQTTELGQNPYSTDPVGQPALGGIFNGQSFTTGTMSGFPWTSLEVLDHTRINPGDAAQPVRSAPVGLTGARTGTTQKIVWSDDIFASYWNVYSTSGGVDTLLGRTYWPEYTVYGAPGALTFKVTAVNGGGESAKSVALRPPLPVRSKRRVRVAMG